VRVLVLGATATGEVAVATAVDYPGVHDIRLGWVDPDDATALCAILDSVDLVVNAIDSDRSGTAVLEAAIHTGTHYLDACDDCDHTARMLDLHDRATAAGVCAVIGMGASPGVTNLLAACAGRELDFLEDVYTAWPVDVPEVGGDVDLGEPRGAAERWMRQLSGISVVLRAGQLCDEQPMRTVTLDLPRGRRGTAYTAGGPEPTTLCRTLAPAGNCASLMVIPPGTAAYLDVLRRDIDRKRLTPARAAEQLDKPTLRRTLRSLVSASKFKGPGTLPSFFATASGTKGGDRRVVLAALSDYADPAGPAPLTANLARFVGIALGLALFQVVDDVRRQAGVHPPEAVVEPYRFFSDLDRCLRRPPYAPSLVVEHRDLCE
jgi:lysine 6-dehydrogenase